MKTLNQIASWIYYNQPVRLGDLYEYVDNPSEDPKLRGLLVKLTRLAPIFEEDDGRLGLRLDLPGFKSFCLKEQTEL